MSSPIRTETARPLLTVDHLGRSVADPVPQFVGRAGPHGRDRIIQALPLNGDGPRQLAPPTVLVASEPSYVGDTGGALVGVSGPVWVHRMLDARWTQDTRRLGG